MNEPKPVASLGPTLLARKGGAKPAMRPQLAAPMGGGAQAARALAQDFDALEDLGWNDMGEDDAPADRSAEVLQLTPAPHNAEAEAETDAGSPKALVRSIHEELAEAEAKAKVEDEDEDEAETEAEAEAEADAEAEAEDEPEAEAEDEDEDEDEDEAEAETEPDTASLLPRLRSVRDEPSEAAEAAALTEVPASPLSTKPRVRSIHEELAEMLEKGESTPLAKKTKPEPKLAKPAPVAAPPPVIEALDESASRRAAFTLRLDAKRHLKLRLASTVRNRSAQQLVTEALDRFLRDIPEVELLARNIQHTSRKKV